MHLHTHKYIKMNKNISTWQRVKDLLEGESLVLTPGDPGFKNARTYASEIGFAMGRKYRVSRNREARTYTIIREA